MVDTKLISFVLPEHRGRRIQHGLLVRGEAFGKLFPDVGNMVLMKALKKFFDVLVDDGLGT